MGEGEWKRVARHVGEGPSDSDWASAIGEFPVGSMVRGLVLARFPFGYFIAVRPGIVGLVRIQSVKDGFVTEDDFPAVDDVVIAVVVDFSNHDRQLRLSTKPSELNASGT